MRQRIIGKLLLSFLIITTSCESVTQSHQSQTLEPQKNQPLATPSATDYNGQISENTSPANSQNPTGGKTIRVEFVSSQSDKQREKVWTEDGIKIKARFTSQSAEYETVWAQATTDVYLINAKAGQQMTAIIKTLEQKDMRKLGLEQIATLDVFNAQTNDRLESKDDQSWQGKIPETGVYRIEVVCGHGGTAYKLKIQIR